MRGPGGLTFPPGLRLPPLSVSNVVWRTSSCELMSSSRLRIDPRPASRQSRDDLQSLFVDAHIRNHRIVGLRHVQYSLHQGVHDLGSGARSLSFSYHRWRLLMSSYRCRWQQSEMLSAAGTSLPCGGKSRPHSGHGTGVQHSAVQGLLPIAILDNYTSLDDVLGMHFVVTETNVSVLVYRPI